MAIAANAARPVRSDSIFFPLMAVAMALTVFAGFSRSFYLKSVFHAPPVLSTLMIVHGLVFTSWIALLITQTGLVAVNRRDLHRTLGAAGIAIAAAMVVLGTWLAIDALRRGEAPHGAPSAVIFFAIPVFSIVAFAILAGAGIANRTRPAWHKRFMILGTGAMLSAAVARLPLGFIENNGPPVFFAVSDVFIMFMALYDAATLKRVHPATLWGAAVVIGSQVVSLALGGTSAWAALAVWLTA